MAKVKNYGLEGVSHQVQLGKQGPYLQSDTTKSKLVATGSDGATLAPMQGANASIASEFVTKAQLDSVHLAESTFTTDITPSSSAAVDLGIIPAGAKTFTTTITVDPAFDGSTSLSVGPATDKNLMFQTSKNDPQSAGTYQSITTANFSADTLISVHTAFVNSTVGTATVTVSYY